LGDFLTPERNGTSLVYNHLAVDFAEATTVQAVIEQFNLPSAMAHLVLVNGVFIPRDARATRLLHLGDELAVWPPIAGG
jgi:sulfur carrier protein ThiS